MLKRTFAVAMAIALALILASCSAEPNRPRLEGSSLVGEWKSGVEYRTSDILYDHGAMVTIVVQENGNAEVTQEYYIKNRGEDSWTKDLSSKTTTATYGLWDYPEAGGLKGNAELCDTKTFATIYEFQYELLEGEKTLVLEGDKGNMTFRKIDG